MPPKLIIHGGLGSAAGFERGKFEEREALQNIAEEAFAFLASHSALETVVYATSLLEDDPLFNAGTGSKLQSDGVIRMSAGVCDGERGRFGGVINIRAVKNPVQIALRLLEGKDSVLAGEEALAYARREGFRAHNPETPARREAFNKRQRFSQTGTVGCVALDAQGRLAAATSTGGKGYEIPGRVSDSATVAGNYANRFAAASCTGIGEDIVNAALAARIVVRASDRIPLHENCTNSIAEVKAAGGSAGVIALDGGGEMFQAATEPYLAYAMHDGTLILF